MIVNRWTPEEEQILAAVYPHHGPSGVAQVLTRTKSAIQMRATLYMNVRMLQKNQRSTEPPKVLADRVRLKFAGEVLTERKMRFGPNGIAYEHGTTAATKEGLQRVPDDAIGLPWVSYPRNADDLNACAARLELLAAGERNPAVMKYLKTEASYLRERARRTNEAKAAA